MEEFLRDLLCIHVLDQFKEEFLAEANVVELWQLLNLFVDVVPSLVHVRVWDLLQVKIFVDTFHLGHALGPRPAVTFLQGCQLRRICALASYDDEPGDPSVLDVHAEGVDIAVDVITGDLQEVSDLFEDRMCDAVNPWIWQAGQMQSQADRQAEVDLCDWSSDQIFVVLDVKSGKSSSAVTLTKVKMKCSAHDSKLQSIADVLWEFFEIKIFIIFHPAILSF